jgi:hypothetical protein
MKGGGGGKRKWLDLRLLYVEATIPDILIHGSSSVLLENLTLRVQVDIAI